MKPQKNRVPLKIFRQIIQGIILLFLSLVLICKAPAYAENHSTEYKVKAVYLYNFTKFVSWPENTLPETSHTINICIIGKNPFGTLLEPLTQMQSQGKNIMVESLEDITALEKKSCQILFIPRSEKASLASLVAKASSRHVLTVSDIDGFAKHDGMIGFVVKDGKVRLEINPSAARQGSLKISAKLLEIATIIQ